MTIVDRSRLRDGGRGRDDPARADLGDKGKTYYFCSRGCLLDFKDDPERILAPGYKPSM